MTINSAFFCFFFLNNIDFKDTGLCQIIFYEYFICDLIEVAKLADTRQVNAVTATVRSQHA